MHSSFFLFLLFMPSSSPLQKPFNEVTTVTHSIASLRNRYRVLLVFAPTRTKDFCDQINQLTHRQQDLVERDVAVYLLLTHDLLLTYDAALAAACNPPTGTGVFLAEPRQNARNGNDHLTDRFHVERDRFTVILLGKDGGEKFRSHAPITSDQLNRIIDAMPMRQSEMRAREKH